MGRFSSQVPSPGRERTVSNAAREIPPKRVRGAQGWDLASGLVVASCLAAIGILLADRAVRPDWDFSWSDHWQGAPVLYLAPAALVGLIWTNVRLLQQGVSQRFVESPKRRDLLRALFVGCLAGLGVVPIARSTFAGNSVSRTWLGTLGPFLFVTFVFVAVSLCSFLLWRAQRGVARGRYGRALLLSVACLASAVGCLAVDMGYYEGLYPHIHTFLELCAFGFNVAAFQLLGFILIRALPVALVLSRALAVFLVALGLAFVLIKPLRTWTDARLAHAWVDEFYVGRTLRRAQELELSLRGGNSFPMARVDHLRRIYDLKKPKLAAKWKQPVSLSGTYPGVKNIVFFYVDTLRYDTAADPEIMPNLAAFRAEALNFQRAYATGSDTLRSLPAVTSGNYYLDKTHPGDVLRLAEAASYQTVLIGAKSAVEFMAELLPTFKFRTKIPISDYPEGEKVWGYGADRSTGEGVTTAGLEFLTSEKANQPFLLWLFQFDAHAWREINSDYITRKGAELGMPKPGGLDVRYLVVAKALDEQFGRVLSTLKSTGRDKDTAVVFLSDHGEGMGQGGFWVHSIFLWESLIRVPLALRIPGVAPRVETAPVSLVDIAPTLAPIFGASSGHYHGRELTLGDGESKMQRRKFPILFRGGRFEGHDRIGILDAHLHRKLVVRLRAAFPELHAYETDSFDATNLARKERPMVKKLLQEVATSPVFPRSDADFALHPQPVELPLEEKNPPL